MIDRFSKYYKRTFALFMEKLYSNQILDKPTLKDQDIESFFIHVTELKARVEELEKAIVVHSFYKNEPLDIEDDSLLKNARISRQQAYDIFKEHKQQQLYRDDKTYYKTL
jgi:hypothetical protein